jgi:hypothetical protein
MTSQEKTKYRSQKDWKLYRKEQIDAVDGYCQCCGIKKSGTARRNLQIHHIQPQHYGNERNHPGCTVVLCALCHQFAEQKYKVRNNKKNIETPLTPAIDTILAGLFGGKNE